MEAKSKGKERMYLNLYWAPFTKKSTYANVSYKIDHRSVFRKLGTWCLLTRIWGTWSLSIPCVFRMYKWKSDGKLFLSMMKTWTWTWKYKGFATNTRDLWSLKKNDSLIIKKNSFIHLKNFSFLDQLPNTKIIYSCENTFILVIFTLCICLFWAHYPPLSSPLPKLLGK